MKYIKQEAVCIKLIEFWGTMRSNAPAAGIYRKSTTSLTAPTAGR